MKHIIKRALFSCLALLLLAEGVFSQVRVELTGFGLFNLNLAFPGNAAINPNFSPFVSGYYQEWQTFFKTAVLEQKSGFGFGGRLAVEITPRIALEGSVEYNMVERQFNSGAIAALKIKMSNFGYGPYFSSVNSAGHLLRFYANVNLNLKIQGPIIPYVTAGLGVTQFNDEPSILIDKPSILERLDLYYDSKISALTFNGGLGIKYFVRPNIGLRLDARVFFCRPKFEQTFGYKVSASVYYPTGHSVLQDGSHLDLSLNAGIVARF